MPGKTLKDFTFLTVMTDNSGKRDVGYWMKKGLIDLEDIEEIFPWPIMTTQLEMIYASKGEGFLKDYEPPIRKDIPEGANAVITNYEAAIIHKKVVTYPAVYCKLKNSKK